jgi:hypothetical protein
VRGGTMLTVEANRASPFARAIVELNIKHFRGLLKTETDPGKRQTLVRLIAEHEMQLSELYSIGAKPSHSRSH